MAHAHAEQLNLNFEFGIGISVLTLSKILRGGRNGGWSPGRSIYIGILETSRSEICRRPKYIPYFLYNNSYIKQIYISWLRQDTFARYGSVAFRNRYILSV
jgi:hypothetical protein